MQRNGILSHDADAYLTSVVESCKACRATSLPQPSVEVSLSALSRQFNVVVCIDHVSLDGALVFHVRDAGSRYSAGILFDATSIQSAISAYETVWLSPCWPPVSLQAGQTFNTKLFTLYLSDHGTSFRRTLPRHHSKTFIESKHAIIHSTFIRLKTHAPGLPMHIAVQRSICISNDLYMSAV